MSKVIEDEYDEPLDERLRRPSTRCRSPPPRSARSTSARLHDGRDVAVKVQYPGVAAAVRADMQNLGMILRLMKRSRPGLDAKAIGDGDPRAHRRGARLRARGPEPAHARAHLPRPPVHRRARRRHVALARARGRQRVRRRPRLRGAQAARPGRARPHRRDRSSASTSAACTATTSSRGDPHPGNSLLLDDGRDGVPGLRAVQADRRRRGRVRARRPARWAIEGRRRASCIEHLHARRLPRRARASTTADELLAQFRRPRPGGTRSTRRSSSTPEIATAGADPDERPALAPLRQDAPRDAAARPPLRPAPGDAHARRARPAARARPTGTASRASGSTATSR